mgnify:CR=1 FL=1
MCHAYDRASRGNVAEGLGEVVRWNVAVVRGLLQRLKCIRAWSGKSAQHECPWDPTELQQFAGMLPNLTFLAQSSQHQLPNHCVTSQP